MDARDRLRRYLEQRRELGESELVLDGMSVDEVMAVVGAQTSARAPRAARGPASAMTPPARSAPPPRDMTAPEAPPASAPAPLPPSTPTDRIAANASTDWRRALGDAQAKVPTSTPSNDARARTIASAPSLTDLATLIASCTACTLHATAKHPVPGEGNPRAELMCIGEAPGANEDEQGRPFVGEAGQLLEKILGAIQLTRESVFICNVLKHRPPANRDPKPDEVFACQPFLRRQVELVRPRVILALGRFAAQTILNSTSSISALRGTVHQYHGIPVIVTYHPAALLRNEAWKRPTWEDVKHAKRLLDDARAADEKTDGEASTQA